MSFFCNNNNEAQYNAAVYLNRTIYQHLHAHFNSLKRSSRSSQLAKHFDCTGNYWYATKLLTVLSPSKCWCFKLVRMYFNLHKETRSDASIHNLFFFLKNSCSNKQMDVLSRTTIWHEVLLAAANRKGSEYKQATNVRQKIRST